LRGAVVTVAASIAPRISRAASCIAAAGEQPIALMARAGHSSMATTKGYLHLAGVVFRDEADALERRLLTSAY
jgi:hypothetical protein